MFDRVYPIKVTGRWNAKLYDEFGNLKQEVSGKNVITEGGLEYLASF
jgi:antitoxin component YwqK of YwqJK toxin-antitoxin module